MEDTKATLNETLVSLFKDINNIEAKAVITDDFKDITNNDMHIIEAIGVGESQNMSAVAKIMLVTVGTLTIAINNLVKKGYVSRVRSEKDRRVVLLKLTDKGRSAYNHHKKFHEDMIEAIISDLNSDEQQVLSKALTKLNQFFKSRLVS